jgi:hypothetical protein
MGRNILKGIAMERRIFLRRRQASIYLRETYGLGRSPSTLAKDAVIGSGPVFRRLNGVPLYSTSDLDEWVASKLSEPMRSTTDKAAAPVPEVAGRKQNVEQRENGVSEAPSASPNVASIVSGPEVNTL